jgi:hypothetical protein
VAFELRDRSYAVGGALAALELVGRVAPPLGPVTGTPARAPPDVRGGAAPVTIAGSCVRMELGQPGSTVDITIPPAGVRLKAASGGDVDVRVRRFGDDFRAAIGVVRGGETASLQPARDAHPAPWHARLTVNASVSACSLG